MYAPTIATVTVAKSLDSSLPIQSSPQLAKKVTNVVSSFLRQTVLRDAVVAAVLGFLVVGLLLWLDYRRLWDTILTLVPLLVGLVVTVIGAGAWLTTVRRPAATASITEPTVEAGDSSA